jgi:hypothetical protein
MLSIRFGSGKPSLANDVSPEAAYCQLDFWNASPLVAI